MEISILGLVLTLAAWASIYLKLRKTESDTPQALSERLRDLERASQAQALDLLERLSRTISQGREEQLKELGRNFLETQERMERALGASRMELKQGLESTTEKLQGQFRVLEAQVAERLEGIGKKVEEKLHQNMQEGFQHFTKVQEHLQAAELKLGELHQVGASIQDLNQLLKLPHLRGGFGEAALERLLADFLPAGSFEMQAMVVPGSIERVDALVHLAKQKLPIDSKFPREQVLPLFESEETGALEEARKKLGEIIRVQAKSIAQKYIRPEHGTTDMALMFLPSETLYFEVVRNGKLFEEMSKLKVYPVSPNTLMMGLKSVSMAQDYYQMARGVERTIEDIKRARKHFDNFEKRFDEVGKGLEKAHEAYSTASRHLQHYEGSVTRLTETLPTDPTAQPGLLNSGDALP
jgi:DNA recombination protein RmuC